MLSLKSALSAIILISLLTGCKEASEVNAATPPPLSSETSAEKRTLSSAAELEAEQGDLTCLQQCGIEARSEVYADCLAEGGAQEACGLDGRTWYRSCLESRCDEAALQLDDCKTECRVTAKSSHAQCLEEGEKAEACQTQKGISVRSCIADCD